MQDVPVPAKLAYRPIQDNGFLLPWFVKVQEHQPVDFRVTDNQRVLQAIQQNRCWVCGDRLGAHKVFVIGPMCIVNRVTSEPPSHLECARYSVKVCPFLSNPAMRRSPRNLPKNHVEPPGIAIARNPGVVALWFVKTYKTFTVDRGLLFNIGEPTEVEWWCRGRPA